MDRFLNVLHFFENVFYVKNIIVPDLSVPDHGRDGGRGEPFDERSFAVRRRRILRVRQSRIQDDESQAVSVGCGSRYQLTSIFIWEMGDLTGTSI